MEDVIVYAPKNTAADYDYIAFSFCGKHSFEDLHIIRISDGDRYNDNLFPARNDTAVETPNGDGMYFIRTNAGPREFTINFAFDDLGDAEIEQLKETFDTTKVGPLWFAEYPFKVYEAKVKTPVVLKYLCFDENGVNKYKGEGTINFICYQPYAHTPDEVWFWNGTDWQYYGDGKEIYSYLIFSNANQWLVNNGYDIVFQWSGEEVSESDSNITATLYKNIETQEYFMYFSGQGKIKEFLASKNPPWFSQYKDKINIVAYGPGITQNGQYSFNGCSNLKKVYFNNDMQEIRTRSFSNTGIKECNLPNSVTTISGYAFYSCEALKTVIFGIGLTEISAGAFWECTGLTDIYYRGTEHQWNNITKGNGNSTISKANYNSKLPESLPLSGPSAFPSTLPFYFEASLGNLTQSDNKTFTIKNNEETPKTLFEIKISATTDLYNIKWNSKTGLVTACTTQNDETTRKAIKHEGKSIGRLPDENYSLENIDSLIYQYQYY